MTNDQIERDFGEYRNREHPWGYDSDKEASIARNAWHAAAEKYRARWVSVKERLPEKGWKGLCLNSRKNKRACEFDDTGTWWICGTLEECMDVTFWLDNVPAIPEGK